MESDYHWLVTIALVTSSIIAVTANSFLLVVFCRRRGLRTVPNRFVINLLITNLLSSILLIPLLLADQEITLQANSTTTITNETIKSYEDVYFKSGVKVTENDTENIEIIETTLLTESTISFFNGTNQKLLCYFAQSSTSFVCTASIFSILLIGINQYFGVIHSLRYHFYVNKLRASIFIVSSWILALFFAILSAVTYSDNSLWHFCHNDRARNQPSDAIRILNTIFAFSYFIVVILAPFVAICVIYVCIYTAAHKNSERMRKSTANANLEYIQVPKSSNILEVKSLPKVHSAPNFTHLVDEHKVRNKVTRTCSDRGGGNANKFISTIKHKISNASVFRYREETRAAKISILVIFLVLVCYIPYGITLVLNSEYINVGTNQVYHYLSLILLIFSNTISPFLFGYRNKRVKREIGKIFGHYNDNGHLPTKRQSVLVRNRSFEDIHESFEHHILNEPFIGVVPEVIVTCKQETERKSILKRVCGSSGWTNYKKCNFITVPDSCISGEARGSFSSASTQISSEE